MTTPDETTPQTEEEERISAIVEQVPMMAAMAAELHDKRDQWAPGVHVNDINTELAALIAYQAMGTYPPRSVDQLLTWALSVLPDAEAGEDNDGQVVIYTGLQVSQDRLSVEKMEEVTDGEG